MLPTNYFDDGASEDAIQRLSSRIFRSSMLRNVPKDRLAFLDDLLSVLPPLNAQTSMGFVKVRRASQTALVHSIAELEGDDQLDARKLCFATFSFTEGFTTLHEPLADLKLLNGRIDRLCREFGLFGFVAPDIEVVYFEDIKQYVLSYHAHGPIGRLDGKDIEPRTLTDAMNALPSSKSILNKAVKVSDRIAYRTGIDNALRSCSYGQKITARVKTVRYKEYGAPRVQTSIDRFSGSHALASLQAWSLLDLLSNVRGIGGPGREIRRAWKLNMQALLNKRSMTKKRLRPTSVAELTPVWREFWNLTLQNQRFSSELSQTALISALAELTDGNRGRRVVRRAEKESLRTWLDGIGGMEDV